jgi:hypothetical protein
MFNWSQLPNELKRIIFKYIKLDKKYQIQLELKEIVNLNFKRSYKNVLDELINSHIVNILYNKKFGILFYKSYLENSNYSITNQTPVGIDFKYCEMISNINNFCYHCKKNSGDILIENVKFKWFNMRDNKYKFNDLNICNYCINIFDLNCCRETTGYTIDDAIVNMGFD